jgi:hypothetical protein
MGFIKHAEQLRGPIKSVDYLICYCITIIFVLGNTTVILFEVFYVCDLCHFNQGLQISSTMDVLQPQILSSRQVFKSVGTELSAVESRDYTSRFSLCWNVEPRELDGLGQESAVRTSSGSSEKEDPDN